MEEMKLISNAELESQWHGQIVLVKEGMSSHLRPGEYIITAAFWETDMEMVFALMDVDYSVDNPNWVAFHFSYQEWAEFVLQLERMGKTGDFMSRFNAFKQECEAKGRRSS